MLYHFVDDSLVPEKCEIKKFRKCPQGKHYDDFFELTKAVKAREEAFDNKRHRLGSHKVMKCNQESYQVVVSKTATDDEIREALFHLEAYKVQSYGRKSIPIYRKEEDDYYIFWWEGSSSGSGRGWNPLMFPNVTWVEDKIDDGHPIDFVIR